MSDSERTKDVLLDEDVSFESLMLSSKTLEGVHGCGFKKPSPIQLRAIPLGKCGFDLIVEAKSGTGKTAVFGIIGLEMLAECISGFQILILAPTREIASQIGHVLRDIGREYKDLYIEIVMGGTKLNEDVVRLKKNKYQILVGSPGRIAHLVRLKAISLSSVRLFVLDEADKLLEESFQKDINFIYSRLPERKQLIAASATYTTELKEFLHKYMRTPSHIKPYISSILLGVTQKMITVPVHANNVRQNRIKFDKLIEILSRIPFKQSLIFCRYQVRAEEICNLLCERGWPTEYLAGCQTQGDRLKSLMRLQSYSCRILVATDLAARGIDATNVDLVVNLDAPTDSATYLHRIGRSGRYGSKGIAVTIVTAGAEEKQFLGMINSLNNTENITKLEFNHTDVPERTETILKPANCTKSPPEKVSNTDFVSLMTYTEDKIKSVPFDDLVTSLDNYENDNENFDINRYVHENNFNLKTHLEKVLGKEIGVSKIIDNTVLKSNHHKNTIPQNYLHMNGHVDNIAREDLQDSEESETDIRINRTETRAPQKSQNSKYKNAANRDIKVNVKVQSSEKKKRPVDRSSKRNKQTNPNRQNVEYVYQDEQYNTGLMEYYKFKQQLDAIVHQIQHTVYINTLLNK